MSRVDMAFQNVERDFFVLRKDGKIVTQSTASEAIKNGLEMLDVQEGHRVLEIGTGSGFSGALLAYLVGAEGSVVSLDIEPELTKRAEGLFKQKEINNVFFETRDGRKGFESEKPYDRIVAWTTPESLPDSWRNQIGENGIIVAPFQVLPIARCTVTVRIRNENGVLVGESVGKEGYIMMSSAPAEDIKAFDEKMHAGLVGEGDKPVWTSAIWMKGIKNNEWCNKFHSAQPEPSPFPEHIC